MNSADASDLGMGMEKRVLLVSHNALSMHRNNGKTLDAIFSNWNRKSLAQLYFNQEIPDTERFDLFFRVTDFDVLKKMSSLGSRPECGGVVRAESGVSPVPSASGKQGVLVGFLARTAVLKRIIRDVIFGTGLWFSQGLKRWLEEFRPEVVFFLGGDSIFSFRIAMFLADYFRVPLDLYLTDDYVVSPRRGGLVQEFMRRRLKKIYRATFARARNVFVIGDEMARVFQAEFGRRFEPIMNAVDIPDSLLPRPVFPCQPGVVDVVYAGGLHLGRDFSLLRFGELLHAISADLALKFRLTIYSLQEPAASVVQGFSEFGVVLGGALSHRELANRLAAADLVLHIESFDPKYVDLTKLSVSTKIPEYLVSGACLLAYGPSDIASIKIVSDNGLGCVLTERDDSERMKEKLIDLVTTPGKRQEYVQNGFEFARDRFDITRIRSFVSNCLNA